MKLVEYVVRQGDTLHTISASFVGTVELTNTIAIVNDLDYPFIDTDMDTVYPSDHKVARLGDTLLIPLEITGSDVIDDISENDSYGIDLLLTTNKVELSMIHIGEFKESQGDLRVTQGRDTLIQDLTHRLMTERGTLVLHPDYGSDLLKMIGEKSYIGWEQKVTIEIMKTMLSDPRVDNIQDMSFEKVDTGIHVRCRLVTPLGLMDFSEYIGGVSQ